MANLVRKEFYTDCTWTAPAGVSSVVVYPIDVERIKNSNPARTDHLLDSDGNLYLWGRGCCGINGDNTVTDRCCPVAVCGGLKFRWFDRGQTAIGLTREGCAYSWGANFAGQVGNGTTTHYCCPVAVCGGIRFKQVTSVTSDVGGLVGITADGLAYSWGCNCIGQLGDGTTTNRCCPVAVCGGLRFKQVFGGNNFIFGITKEGCLYSWGVNTSGVLGDGTTTNRCCPVAVCGGLRFKCILTPNAANVALGLTVDGCLYTWGENSGYGVGDCTTTNRCCPVAACTTARFKELSMLYNTAFFGLSCEGIIYAWGNNSGGQLGIGTDSGGACVPTAVCTTQRFAKLVFMGGITVNGDMYLWGQNPNGEVGDGTITNRCCPVAVCGGLKFIDRFYYSSIATDGFLYSWGYNGLAELGDGTTTSRCCPVAVCSNITYNYQLQGGATTFSVVPGSSYSISLGTLYQVFNGSPISCGAFGVVLEYVL